MFLMTITFNRATHNQQQHQQHQQQQQAWQQYNQAPGTQQQYDAYYQQHYNNQTPEQKAYYQHYYGNPPAPGTSEAPPGVSQPAAATGYDYNYQYNNYYAQHPGYSQAPQQAHPYGARPPPPPQQYQQPYYSQQQQQQHRPPPPPQHHARPPPPPPPSTNHSATISAQPVLNKTKIPPWATKQTEPPKPAYQPPPPAPAPAPVAQQPEVKTEEQKQNERNAMATESWPPSLKQYVQDVFANCLPNKRDLAETQLRNLILESHQAGTLMTTDWSEMDLPSACKPQKKKKKGKKNNLQQKNNPLHQVQARVHQPSAEEEAKRLRRQRRFEEDAAQFRAENVSAPMQQMHLDGDNFNHTVVGTSTKLEKNYLRLTSAPDPATVRPLHILRQTLVLLKDKWKSEQNYTYICDQFKSMRQDLTVQRIKNEFTVQVYEIHARIALEKSDLGEYNQCQTQLKGLYASGIAGHVMEFTAYRILYFLHTQNWADVNSTMAELTKEQKDSECVQHALNVRSSLATGNFHRFFILYRSAPNMGAYLMDQFVERERVQSLIILCKSCRPNLPLTFITKELGFDTEEELLKFLTEQNAKILKANDSTQLDTRLALVGLTESVKKYKKIDIKGQV